MSKQETAVQAIPSFLLSLNDGAKGNEGVTANDLQIPQLKVLQPLSPEVLEAKKPAGTMYNTLTRECKEEITCINLSYVNEFSIWRKRHQGGGRVGSYPSAAEAHAAIAQLDGSADNYDVADTGIHKLLLLSPDGKVEGPAVMYCASTAKMFSDSWNTDIHMTLSVKKLPRYSGIWKVSVVSKKNAKGAWYGLQQEFVDYVRVEALFHEAAGKYEALAAPALQGRLGQSS